MAHPILTGTVTVLGSWLTLETAVRLYLEWPLRTDFYGSIGRDKVRDRQTHYGLRVATGAGWAHLGWIADPAAEIYVIERRESGRWQPVATAEVGSFLTRQGGRYRVLARAKDGSAARVLGEAEAEPGRERAPLCVPRITGPWQTVFQPATHGDYINDHTVYRDAEGNWRVMGITSKGTGDYAAERYFAVGVGPEFPPPAPLRECDPVADFDELAWAPHVVAEGGTYYVFWSPHRLHRMRSADGIHWVDHQVILSAPVHKFFRDAMVLKVADGQWLLYTTARGAYFSQVDVYQSFDLDGWQYIGTALRSGWGSERNAVFASTESPAVTVYRGHYYLSITYNNDSFFWTAVLLPLRIWLDRRSYNETLIFHSDNPYDFGVYRGRRSSPSLLTRLDAHAAEIVHVPERDAWYITTAGWPWVATLTRGEVAAAPLNWDALPAR